MKTRLLIFLLLLLSFRGYSQSCISNVSITQSEPAICNGNAIILTATPTGGTPAYTYAWSTGASGQTTTVNKAGTYTVNITDKTSGCTPYIKSITVVSAATPAPPNGPPPTAVCSGSTAALTASGSSGSYQWYDALTGGNFLFDGATYVTDPITTGKTFYVQTTANGCPSARTAVFVTIVGKPVITSPAICSGNPAVFTATGGDTYAWYASPGSTIILATGDTFVSPILTSNKTYYVVATTGSCVSQYTPGTATVSSPPQAPGGSALPVCSGSSANLHATGAAGGVFDWFSSATGGNSLISSPDFTTPPLTQTTDYWVQVTTGTCVSPRTKVTVKVNPIPAAPATQQPIEVCYNSSQPLTAGNDPALTYNWYDAPFGGTHLKTGAAYTPAPLTNSTVYYVDASSTTCTSARTKIVVNVDQPLPTPQVSSPTICYNTRATLTPASPGGTYTWFNAAGTKITTPSPSSFTTPLLTATTTYFVQTKIGNCTSARVPVVVTVNPVTPVPTAPPVSVCPGSTAHLNASGGTNYAWYNSLQDINPVSTGESYDTPPITATKTFYVESINNDCASQRIAVTVSLSQTPQVPTVTINPATICKDNPATLTATTVGGGTFDWYDQAGNHLFTGAVYATQPLAASTTFYVTNSIGQCTSNKVPVTVPVTIIPDPQFQYSSGSICTGTVKPTPTIYNPYGGTFSSSPGLKFVSVTTGEIDPVTSMPGNYIVTFTSNAPCPTTSKQALYLITTADATFSYNGPYCQNSPNAIPSISAGASGGTFSCTNPGLVFTNTGTGEVNLKASIPGTYTVTNTITATPGCTGGDVKTATITIAQGVFVKANPTAAQPIAQGSTYQLQGSITGAATTGKWSGGTGSFSNPSSLTATYTPGPGETSVKLTLISDIPAGGTCGAQSDSFTLFINAAVVNPTASALPICAGSKGKLSATAPGGNYQWFDVATGGTALASGAGFITPNPLLTTTTFYVLTTINNLTSGRTPVTVTVNEIPAQPVCSPPPACSGSTALLTATGSPGTYEWYDSEFGGTKLSADNPFITPVLSATTTYYVQSVINGCVSGRTPVTITVNPLPVVNSDATNYTCSGTAKPYTATADLPGTTFTWTRDAVAGISNTAATGNSAVIDEVLNSTAIGIVNVLYKITPHLQNCDGAPFIYTLQVYPNPAVIDQGTPDPICSGTSPGYTIKFNLPTGVSFNWSRDAVAGISNAPVSGQSASTINEVLFNENDSPVTVNYKYNYKTTTCDGPQYTYSIVVRPAAKVTNPTNVRLQACSGVPQNFKLTSNINYAIFFYSRSAINGISNAAVSLTLANNGIIDEALVNTTTKPINVVYSVVASADGCSGKASKYTVVVDPLAEKPKANSNSPVCVGTTIHINTSPVAGTTNQWTLPDGSTVISPSLDLPAPSAGTYTYRLVVISAKGCASVQSDPIVVQANDPPQVDAGPDQNVCVASPSVFLNGKVISASHTGLWSTSGTGTFTPSITALNAQYLPTDADVAKGSVVLTLYSTTNDNCVIAHDDLTLTFSKQPAVNAGIDTVLCGQIGSYKLAGKVFVAGGAAWTSSGTGTFSPNANQVDATYTPGAADIQNGSVLLMLTALNPGPCFSPSASVNIKFTQPPGIYAGGTRYVLQGNTITLNPIVNQANVSYLWSPNYNINDPTLKNPVITGGVDTTYTLTVTDSRGCVSQDKVKIIVSPTVTVANTFTPNADGVNDTWNITGLIAYENATVDIFTRNGQKIFHSLGYPRAWDGTYNGKPMPVGVYYYVIDTKFKGQLLSGYVTIIR